MTVARNDSAWASVSSSGAFLPGRGAFCYRVSDVSGHPISPHGLGKGLVEDGYLDLDPDQSPNLYEVFTGTKPAALAIRQTKVGIDVLTSHVLMAAVEQALEPGDEGKLLELITPLKACYDIIFIDNPPGKAVLAFNGLAAADLFLSQLQPKEANAT